MDLLVRRAVEVDWAATAAKADLSRAYSADSQVAEGAAQKAMAQMPWAGVAAQYFQGLVNRAGTFGVAAEGMTVKPGKIRAAAAPRIAV